MEAIKDFLSDINYINIGLAAFALFAGGIWYKGREKLKQIGELFLKAHEYTDDKKLSKAEREDLLNRFLQIAGKGCCPVVPALPEPEPIPEPLPETEPQHELIKPKRRKNAKRQ
jgi:hypothetical protein